MASAVAWLESRMVWMVDRSQYNRVATENSKMNTLTNISPEPPPAPTRDHVRFPSHRQPPVAWSMRSTRSPASPTLPQARYIEPRSTEHQTDSWEPDSGQPNSPPAWLRTFPGLRPAHATEVP